MLKINHKADCCGCTACKSVCPKDAIEMKEDTEGFLYPSINKEKCINCGLCEKVCPMIQKKEKKQYQQKAYVLNNKNDEIRKQSTSGGAFTPIAEYIIEKGGVVFGATLDENLNVYHTYVTNKEDLKKFRGSKYVQSNLKSTFKEARDFLNDNKWVCFSGTPCQIQGLKNFLIKDYEKLVTIDVVCRGVPSPLVLKKYIEYQKQKRKIDKIDNIVFRDKEKYGYQYSTMSVEGKNVKYSQGVETDPYLRAFFNNYSDRLSCYQCHFRSKDRISDFTIWDCFTIAEFDKKLDDNKGTTRLLIQSELGEKIFENIKEKFYYKELEVEEAVKNVRELKESPIPNDNREKFFYDINCLNADVFFEKYFPDSIKVKIERTGRKILIKTGIYDQLKNSIKKIIKKG